MIAATVVPKIIELFSEKYPRVVMHVDLVQSPTANYLYRDGSVRLRGGAGRTRTNHQSVMEHGSSPTNSPGRTPMQIAGRFAVLLDFPGFLILESTTRVLWNMVRVRPTTLVGPCPDRR